MHIIMKGVYMKVSLKNITKTFPARNRNSSHEIIAVNGFDLDIPDGYLVGLLGPSGCGKSTTLNMISGLLKPSNGKIYFGDTDVTDIPAEKRGIGLVFQNYALYPHLTVEQNIIFPLQNFKGKDKLRKKQMHEKALRVAALVQLENLLDRKPSELSGGQQQRVAIARALVKEPKVLLLDEPLSNLDARLRLQTREEIRRIQRETGITTIFVTHDQEEAMSISDLIVVMKDGVIQQTGAPQTIYDNPDNLFVAKFLGSPSVNVFDANITDGGLFIGNNKILDISCLDNQKVYAAIRPEGFVVDQNGTFECSLKRIEVMGRDVTVVCGNEFCISNDNHIVRAIINSDENINISDKTVRFSVNPRKIYLFDYQTQNRISFC